MGRHEAAHTSDRPQLYLLGVLHRRPHAGAVENGSTFEEAFGRALLALRTEAGRSQEELAEAASLSTFYLRELEHGRGNATMAVVLRLSSALGLRPHELVQRAEAAWGE